MSPRERPRNRRWRIPTRRSERIPRARESANRGSRTGVSSGHPGRAHSPTIVRALAVAEETLDGAARARVRAYTSIEFVVGRFRIVDLVRVPHLVAASASIRVLLRILLLEDAHAECLAARGSRGAHPARVRVASASSRVRDDSKLLGAFEGIVADAVEVRLRNEDEPADVVGERGGEGIVFGVAAIAVVVSVDGEGTWAAGVFSTDAFAGAPTHASEETLRLGV